jgi:hypothetical protein
MRALAAVLTSDPNESGHTALSEALRSADALRSDKAIAELSGVAE